VKGQGRTREYKPPVLKLLWGLSDGICAYPDCGRPLIVAATESDPHAIVGKICHIISLSPTGPRSDSSKSVEYLNSHDNLILFCGTHHDEVDLQENTFTVETLQKWKTDHEKRALMRIQQAMAGVGFHELERMSWDSWFRRPTE
jgi:hypothetical protein